jgi:hypothetical protein
MSRQAEALCIFQEADTAHREWHLLPGSELAQGSLIAFWVAFQHFSDYGAKPECQEPGQLRQIKVKPELSWLVPDSESAPFAWI